MNVRLYRLSRLALLWAFAFAVALAPWLGGSHVEARPIGHMDVQAAMPGEDPAAPEAMMAHGVSMDRDCTPASQAMPAMQDMTSHGPGEQTPHKSKMTGCEDMCRMACHVVVILPAAPSMPRALGPAHEARPVSTLETVECDVLVPPPRQAA